MTRIPISTLRREAERSGAFLDVYRKRLNMFWPNSIHLNVADSPTMRRLLLAGLRALPTKKRSATKRKASR